MGLMIKIIEIHGREILDSRGNPTVEVEVTAQTETTGKKTTGRESVPSGASTGRFEAIELRDGQERYFGLGVQRVVDHINTKIRKELLGMNVLEQVQIDRKLVELDGTDNKGNLGANALLGVSLACARCAAAALDMPLYRYLGGPNAKKWPMPMMNVINGGAHAKNYHPEPVPEDLRRLSCGMDRNVILGLAYSALWITSTQRSARNCWE